MTTPEDVRSNLYPSLTYADAAAAIEWLSEAFGFEPRLHVVLQASVDGYLKIGAGRALLPVELAHDPADGVHLDPGVAGGAAQTAKQALCGLIAFGRFEIQLRDRKSEGESRTLTLHRFEPDLAPMELDQLRYFLRVAERGSFTRAAEDLAVTQPALSRSIRKLEDELGQPVFEREMRDSIRPHEIEGLISTAHVPNDDGSWTVVAVWETKVEAMAAAPRIRAEWDRRAGQLAAPPVVETAGVSVWEGA